MKRKQAFRKVFPVVYYLTSIRKIHKCPLTVQDSFSFTLPYWKIRVSKENWFSRKRKSVSTKGKVAYAQKRSSSYLKKYEFPPKITLYSIQIDSSFSPRDILVINLNSKSKLGYELPINLLFFLYILIYEKKEASCF